MANYSNFSLYSLYHAEACKEFVGPISSFRLQATHLLSKKYHSGGEPLAAFCLIWPAWDLNLRPPALETNTLPLDQVTGPGECFIYCILDRADSERGSVPPVPSDEEPRCEETNKYQPCDERAVSRYQWSRREQYLLPRLQQEFCG